MEARPDKKERELTVVGGLLLIRESESYLYTCESDKKKYFENSRRKFLMREKLTLLVLKILCILGQCRSTEKEKIFLLKILDIFKN